MLLLWLFITHHANQPPTTTPTTFTNHPHTDLEKIATLAHEYAQQTGRWASTLYDILLVMDDMDVSPKALMDLIHKRKKDRGIVAARPIPT